MTNEEEEIKNLKTLTKKDWEGLKEQARIGTVNSKIGFYQHTALLELATSKIAEFKTEDDKEGEAAIKDVIKSLTE